MMSQHPFDSDYRITPEQKARFQRDGFVKLDGFLNANVVAALLDRVEVEMGRSTLDNLKANSLVNRTVYDFVRDKSQIFELVERHYFRRALTDLAERDLFFISEQAFEIEKNADKGLPWHVGVQVFGYQVPDEFGCTIWAPLHPVDANGQGGGMAYVPQHVVSGEFIFEQVDPAVISTFKAKEQAGVSTNVGEFWDVRNGILNSSAMTEILETHRIEDDFEPGDVFLFNKNVVHRSAMLGEGPLARRAAYVMRFVEAGSRYNLEGAQNVEFPAVLYSKGLIPYKGFTRQHIEIAEAGAANGDLLAECAYFDDRERRMLRREQSPDGA